MSKNYNYSITQRCAHVRRVGSCVLRKFSFEFLCDLHMWQSINFMILSPISLKVQVNSKTNGEKTRNQENWKENDILVFCRRGECGAVAARNQIKILWKDDDYIEPCWAFTSKFNSLMSLMIESWLWYRYFQLSLSYVCKWVVLFPREVAQTKFSSLYIINIDALVCQFDHTVLCKEQCLE